LARTQNWRDVIGTRTVKVEFRLIEPSPTGRRPSSSATTTPVRSDQRAGRSANRRWPASRRRV